MLLEGGADTIPEARHGLLVRGDTPSRPYNLHNK